MKYAHWTNHEIRRLREMHAEAPPILEALRAAFPRHPADSIRSTAQTLGLRRRKANNVPVDRIHYWLRVAHEYFARRESGMIA